MWRLIADNLIVLVMACLIFFVIGVGFGGAVERRKKLKDNVIGTMTIISDGEEDYICVECTKGLNVHNGDIVCFEVDFSKHKEE